MACSDQSAQGFTEAESFIKWTRRVAVNKFLDGARFTYKFIVLKDLLLLDIGYALQSLIQRILFPERKGL